MFLLSHAPEQYFQQWAHLLSTRFAHRSAAPPWCYFPVYSNPPPNSAHLPLLCKKSSRSPTETGTAAPAPQILEVPNDRAMARTARRPLPAGKLTVAHAAAFATLSTAAGVGLLACHGNPLMAGLAAGNVALYALCYTPLKQISVWNTWVGAVVGDPPFTVCTCNSGA